MSQKISHYLLFIAIVLLSSCVIYKENNHGNKKPIMLYKNQPIYKGQMIENIPYCKDGETKDCVSIIPK